MMTGPTIGSAAGFASRAQEQIGANADKLSNVATEFESLLVAQLLKSMRASSSGGWLSDGEDQAGATMIEMAEQQLAKAIAAQGGLALGDLIVKGWPKKAQRSEGSRKM